MRRISKKFLFLFFGLLFIALYCECLIYYEVISQCSWPSLKNGTYGNFLKALILADTHLLGPYRGHWFDKLRREWQMHQAFKAIVNIHNPEVVFLLGDLFDEGEWTDDKQFDAYVERFYKLFPIPENTKMYIAPGNHDIGFHNRIRRKNLNRFVEKLNAPSVQHIILKDCNFIIINSMALQGDSCHMCTEARKQISLISDGLNKCLNTQSCDYNGKSFNYSRPILLQHFPLYRVSDSVCTEPDAPPIPERHKKFRLKIDALSKEATDFLIEKIKPRAVFGGHTHHGCLLEYNHRGIEFLEYSVPSFSWRNRPDPKYMLVSLTSSEYAVNKCTLPTEVYIIVTAVTLFLCLLLGVIFIIGK